MYEKSVVQEIRETFITFVEITINAMLSTGLILRISLLFEGVKTSFLSRRLKSVTVPTDKTVS